MSPTIDFTTFNFGEKREVGRFGNYTVYAQTFQDTIGAQNTWKSFGNIGTGKIGLFAFGSFTSGTENHFFPGGTNNTEMTSVYYDSSTGTVNVKTIHPFPVNTSARVTIFWLE